MKKADVRIGAVYECTVSNKLTKVRVEGEHRYGGFLCTNLTTGREVRIKSAMKFRQEVTE